MPGMPIVMAGKNGPDPVDADCPKHGPQCPARVVELASRPQPVQPANRVGRTKTPPHDGAPSLASAAPPTVPHSFTTVSRTPLRCQVSLRGGRPGGVAALRVDLCPADLGPAIVGEACGDREGGFVENAARSLLHETYEYIEGYLRQRVAPAAQRVAPAAHSVPPASWSWLPACNTSNRRTASAAPRPLRTTAHRPLHRLPHRPRPTPSPRFHTPRCGARCR